ncbi:MAG: hypothetical protein ABI206_02530 [Antricoccus sp.]
MNLPVNGPMFGDRIGVESAYRLIVGDLAELVQALPKVWFWLSSR